jgi:hypothetical protein
VLFILAIILIIVVMGSFADRLAGPETGGEVAQKGFAGRNLSCS